MQIKYLLNEHGEPDKNMGIDYDWNFLKKEYKKLKCPPYVYSPLKLPLSNSAYFILMSERETGKTTNVLLFGMLMHKHYGTVIQYIRQSEDMIMNKTIQELFKTIREFNYIPKITDGKYNDVIYNARKWYYVLRDEDGNIIEKANTHFMYCLSIDKNEMFKSSYNAPLGDLIIVDEFISKRYRMNEFVYLMDLISTIKRARMSVRIVLLANTIDPHSEYFNEFEIYDQVQLLEEGQSEILTTELGTKIYIEWIKSGKSDTVKQKLNAMYFGFKNPRLSAITGGSWATNNYPHFMEEYTVLERGIYVEYHDRLLAIDIVQYEDIGIFLHVRKGTKTYDDSIIYSLNEPKDSRYRFYMGRGDNLDKWIVSMVQNHRVKFQNNAVATMFFNHFNKKDAKKAGY